MNESSSASFLKVCSRSLMVDYVRTKVVGVGVFLFPVLLKLFYSIIVICSSGVLELWERACSCKNIYSLLTRKLIIVKSSEIVDKSFPGFRSSFLKLESYNFCQKVINLIGWYL